MKVAVIGSGIAGLTAAIALARAGHDAVVFERAPELREVGAGISLWANALRALDHVGAGDVVRRASLRMERSELQAREGRKPLLAIDAAPVAARYGLPELVRMIHRADLVAALATLVPPDALRFGRECVGVEDVDRRPCVRFADGGAEAADVVVGADGIHSAVRRALFGASRLRYSGYTCWRGIAPRPPGLAAGYIGEWWGRGRRFGITTIPGDRVYWFAVQNAPPGQPAADDKAQLLTAFRDWAAPCPELLESTPAEQILHNDIIDRPPALPWGKGRVVLIGDAAHPTTPNLGQGGCLAIEDAVVLARALGRGGDPATALAAFAAERHPRTAAVVNESWRFGRLAQLDGRLSCWLRDTAIGLVAPLLGPGGLLKYARFDVGPVGGPAG